MEQLLEHGDFPFADDLLQSIKSQRQAMEQGQVGNGLSPEAVSAARQGANMGAVEQLYGAMRSGE